MNAAVLTTSRYGWYCKHMDAICFIEEDSKFCHDCCRMHRV